MGAKLLNVCIAVLLLVGLGFVLYPSVNNYYSEREMGKVLTNFEGIAAASTDNSEMSEMLDRLQADFSAYNEELFRSGQVGLRDPFFYETKVFDLSQYGRETDVIGKVNIPKMNVELPLYLGATQENMALGAANLGYTSVPLGGANTNAVISAHRGYGTAPYLRDIESLELGDKIYLTNFWETLAYQVVEIKIIQPTEIEEVRIQEGHDLLTLLTCHPYTQNYQRYVVYGERVDFEGIEESGSTLNFTDLSQSQTLILLERFAPIVIIIIIVLTLFLIKTIGVRPPKL